jgi:tRNA dimethylallyltransferase
MNSPCREIWLMGGVTASGKTELSIAWAQKNNAEIISCDSVSFYRGLDIGSAKPTALERGKVKHHGLDLADVSETFDVGKYHAYAKGITTQLLSQQKKILVVGGSGFFMDGFLRPVVDSLDISDSSRCRAEEIFSNDGLGGMLEALNPFNPNGLGDLDKHNPVRVLRALERCIETGKSLEEIRQTFEGMPLPYDGFSKNLIWLDRQDEELRERIQARTRKMIDQGIIEETKEALKLGMEQHPSLALSVGYREVIRYLRDEGTVDELCDSINRSTWQLVRKQRKWFRKRFPASSHHLILGKEQSNEEILSWVAHT